MKNTEIEKKLKRIKWIRNVINNHLDDVEEILNSVLDEQPKTPKLDTIDDLVKAFVRKPKFRDYTKWDSYRAVIAGLKDEEKDPERFAHTVGRLFYAMSKNGIPLDEASGFVEELTSHLKSDITKKYIERKFSIYYPKSCEVDDQDLGMP